MTDPAVPSPSPAPAGAPRTARLEHLYLLAPLALFLALRLFGAFEHLQVSADQCKYLTLGRTFPLHRVDGDALFLLHPPAFGYTIGLLALVAPLVAAGLLATLLYAAATFLTIRALGRTLGASTPGLAAGLLFVALDRASVAYDTHVSRVPIMLFSFAVTLLAYERWRVAPTMRRAGWVVGATTFAGLVSDQALSLLACQVVIFAVHLERRRLPQALGLLAASAASMLVWPAVRLWVYAHHPDFPAGLDGTIELTQPIVWRSLFQPHYLPFTHAHTSLYMNVGLSLAEWDPGVLLRRPLDLLMVPAALAGAAAVTLVVAAFVDPRRRRAALGLALLALLLLTPAAIGLMEWHGMGFVIPFAVLLSLGATTVLERVAVPARWLAPGCAAACLLLSATWISNDRPGPSDVFHPSGGPHFLFLREPVTRAQGFSRLLQELPPGEAVMAPVGLTPELVYLTGKRVLALPFDPALIERFAREYGVTRIVLSDETMRRYASDEQDRWSGAVATRFVLQHPERFQPLASEDEAYPAFYPPGTFVLLRPIPAPP